MASLGGYTYWAANAAAQAQIPLQKGPKGATGAIWSVSPNDNTATLLTASQSTLSSGPSSVIGTLTQSWSHVWSRTTPQA